MEFEDKSKLFVFDKKEVSLIFIFVLVITVTSFTLGIRIGKGLSLKADGYTKEDIAKTIDLKSVEEEQADEIMNNKEDPGFENSLPDGSADTASQKLNELADPEKLDSEFSNISKGAETEVSDKKEASEEDLQNALPSEVAEVPKATENALTPKDGNSYKGKFTINLASKKSREEAEEFAAPYLASELEVVVNKVATSDKGTWYRIGIGVFDNYNDAKDFLEKNPIFFKDKKYWITEIK